MKLPKKMDAKNIVERDLLVAILDERDNIPVRALVALGLDVADLRRKALTRDTPSIPQTFVTVDFAPDFGHEVDNEVLFILRRMFHGYAQIRIQTQLTGGYSSSQLFVVTPIHIDKREDASLWLRLGRQISSLMKHNAMNASSRAPYPHDCTP
jgi:hypothetical protein